MKSLSPYKVLVWTALIMGTPSSLFANRGPGQIATELFGHVLREYHDIGGDLWTKGSKGVSISILMP
jgi:hypothetical protein